MYFNFVLFENLMVNQIPETIFKKYHYNNYMPPNYHTINNRDQLNHYFQLRVVYLYL